MTCVICGARIDFEITHHEWHASQDLQIDLLRSIVDAQLKRIVALEGRVTDVTPGPPGRGRGQGVVSLFPES